MKIIFGLLILSNAILTSECPVHTKVGNTINFLRLFKEAADLDWDYQNLNTDFALRLHDIKPTKGKFDQHNIVFEISEKELNGRTWFYMIQALYDETDVLVKIEKFARLRKYENDQNSGFAERINQLLVDQFFIEVIRGYNIDGDNNFQEHYAYPLHEAKKTSCNPLTKMEYVYFPYLSVNYYKDGAKEGWGLREPVLSA